MDYNVVARGVQCLLFIRLSAFNYDAVPLIIPFVCSTVSVSQDNCTAIELRDVMFSFCGEPDGAVVSVCIVDSTGHFICITCTCIVLLIDSPHV